MTLSCKKAYQLPVIPEQEHRALSGHTELQEAGVQFSTQEQNADIKPQRCSAVVLTLCRDTSR
jgi:hypothetical protein